VNIINKYGNYIIHNPNYKERVLDFLERQFFIKHIGIELTEILPGNTHCRLKVEEIHKQQHGFLHGGVIATMADVVAGCAAYTLVHEDHHVVTGEIKISYLNPGTGPNLLAVGWVLKQGRKINFCESEVWNVDGKDKQLIAKASATMVTLFPGDLK